MDSLLKLPVVSGASIRILQITDTHLFSGRHETLLGVNTWASFNAVLDAIEAERQPIDL
ncbi:MAG: 3',5'-cyclic-AMP phosphodiesterase, partial [Mixta calida]|nr:3',5'-cyclic-AMP phosphodiesterase [Mixta calida]